MMWCPVVAPRKSPQAPRSSQAATQPAASEPGPSTPLPAKRTKRTKAEPEAAEPTKGKGKAAKAKPAPQPGRWLDRDCNAALNMQRIGESRWRPLELCYWPEQGALPAKGKEYPGLGYKRVQDKPPKAQEQQQQPAMAQGCHTAHTPKFTQLKHRSKRERSTPARTTRTHGNPLTLQLDTLTNVTKPNPRTGLRRPLRRKLSQLGLVNALAAARPDFLVSQNPLPPSTPAPSAAPTGTGAAGTGTTTGGATTGATGTGTTAIPGAPARSLPTATSISNPGSVSGGVAGRSPSIGATPGPNLTSGLAGTTSGGLAGGTGIGAGSGGPGNAGVGSAGASVGNEVCRETNAQSSPSQAQQNMQTSGEARWARHNNNTWHAKKCKLHTVMKGVSAACSEEGAVVASEVIEARPYEQRVLCVEACSKRALLASLLLGLMVRGWFTRVTVLADGQEAFEDIPAEDAVIPNLGERHLYLQLGRGLPPLGETSRPSAAVEAVLAAYPGLHARLNAVPRYEHDTNTVDDVGKKLETSFANSLTELFPRRLEQAVALAGARVIAGSHEHQRRFKLPLDGSPAWTEHQRSGVARSVQGEEQTAGGSQCELAAGLGGLAGSGGAAQYQALPPPSPSALTPGCSCKAHHIKLDTEAITKFKNGVAGPRDSELFYASLPRLCSRLFGCRRTAHRVMAKKKHKKDPGKKQKAASSAGTSLEANLKHITVTLATWDAVWEVYLDPKWARQRLRLYGAQEWALEQFFNKLEREMAQLSMNRHGRAKQLVVFFGAATIGTGGGWGADAVLRACRKVVCRPRGTDQLRGRVVLVDEHRTSRVSSAVNGQQPCEEGLDHEQPTRRAGWKPPAGQVEPRLVRPAWSQQRDQPVRGMMWCPVVAPRKSPQAPRSSQAATQPAASEPGPSTPLPAKRTKRTKAEPEAAEPTKGKGKAAKAKPAPQPGRWLDRDCNAALNMQRIGESRWRPLELCYWPEQGALPAKGKEYPGLGYKRVQDKPPKAQEQQQQPAMAQ
ncbi:hypothetical protein QJQ45_011914 [Haematococcus lacustris]|nr:hypothetical protein QJQ45_011914 [Haematococcus lacustris]